MAEGLNKDGGINFERKRNFETKKEPEMFSRKPGEGNEEPDSIVEEEPRQIDKEELLRQERLGAKLVKAKRVQAGGFAINGGSVMGMLFAIDSFMFDPTTLETLNTLNTTLGLNINFEGIITLLQEHKAQVIGFCLSMQTFIMAYKDTCQKMKDRDTESFTEVINDELGKMGI